MIIAVLLLIIGIIVTYSVTQIDDLNRKLADNKLEVAKPIYCDGQNTCYVLKAWMNLNDANQSDPYKFNVVNQGLTLESVSISDVQEG
jgi:hypothetical protein